MRLRTRFALVFCGLTTFVVLLTGLFLYISEKAQLERRAKDELNGTLQKFAGRHTSVPALRLRNQNRQVAMDVFAELRPQPAEGVVVATLLDEEIEIFVAKFRLTGDLIGDDFVQLRRNVELHLVRRCGDPPTQLEKGE